MRADLDANGSFTSWHRITDYDISFLIPWIRQNFGSYTGMLNIECIGTKPIEAHLRFSPQFVTLYGKNWLHRVVELYTRSTPVWPTHQKIGHSYVLRVPKTDDYHTRVPQACESEVQALEHKHDVEIQLTYDIGIPLKNNLSNDLYTYRIAVINGFDAQVCERVRELLLNHFFKTASC